MRNQTNTSQDDFLTLRFWQICSHSHSADNRRLHCRRPTRKWFCAT